MLSLEIPTNILEERYYWRGILQAELCESASAGENPVSEHPLIYSVWDLRQRNVSFPEKAHGVHALWATKL